MMTRIRISILSAAVAFVACGPKEPTENSNPNTQPEVENPGEFTGGGQEGTIGADVYPGPYGVGIGSVVHNYQFLGYPRSHYSTDMDGDGKRDPIPGAMDQFQTVELSHFYNPTGNDVYPEGSPYGEGTPKPRALIIDRSAVWCGPCNKEAAIDIPDKRKTTAPYGEFLVVLDETSTPGEKAVPGDIQYWAAKYRLDYPGVIDPAQRLDAIVGVAAYPGNVIVRTKDMKIIAWTAGTPDAAFWQTFQDVMDGKPVLPGE